ncbi:MAG: hypothetical protein QXV60_00460 [Nitrososphaerota archaeon]
MFVAALREAFKHPTTPEDYRYDEDENDPTKCKLRIYRAFPQRQFRPPCLVVNTAASDAKFRYLGEEAVRDIYRVTNETVTNDALYAFPILRIKEVKDDIGTIYIEGTDFTFDYKNNFFNWIHTKPSLYFCTYDTFKFISKDYTVITAKKIESQIEVPVRITIYALRTTDRERLTDLVILYTRSVFRDKFKPFTTYLNISIGGETEETWENAPLFINTVTIDCWSHYSHEIDYSLYTVIEKINIQAEVQRLAEGLP